jgi:flavorubredoxin
MHTVPDPIRIAEGTYLVRPLVLLPGRSLALHVNSLVIQGAEPVIVDTGAALFRDDWIEQVFGLVDPQDVRWIYLSNDDRDHTGNLAAALEACPQATVVTGPPSRVQVATELDFPSDRRRCVGDGERLDLADRRLLAVRPPTFACPTTRGLYDSATGVYWSTDAFGTPVPEAVDSVADLSPTWWHEASMAYSSLLSPWHRVVDREKFGFWIDRVARLPPTVIAPAHGPALLGRSVELALEAMRELPELPAVAPDQDFLGGLTTLPVT